MTLTDFRQVCKELCLGTVLWPSVSRSRCFIWMSWGWGFAYTEWTLEELDTVFLMRNDGSYEAIHWHSFLLSQDAYFAKWIWLFHAIKGQFVLFKWLQSPQKHFRGNSTSLH